ncbi:hypothetical protein BpHYR1_052795 [Brachionus plicatilis]|uniref:Uncharacterized protein n=1 Tax=Brachionus plicatilis TaxID=10195 RepID=A0A3M7T121_BRAPC|nr:hypothetical protein BpHYR1_052795 [Brachionus plicatilis]
MFPLQPHDFLEFSQLKFLIIVIVEFDPDRFINIVNLKVFLNFFIVSLSQAPHRTFDLYGKMFHYMCDLKN